MTRLDYTVPILTTKEKVQYNERKLKSLPAGKKGSCYVSRVYITYDVKNYNWNEYVEILEQYFYANDIDDEKKQIAVYCLPLLDQLDIQFITELISGKTVYKKLFSIL